MMCARKLAVTVATLALAAIGLTTGCVETADERAELDLEVGSASAGGVDFRVEDGLAAIHAIEPGSLTLWAQAPVLEVVASPATGATTRWALTVDNVMPSAELEPVEANAPVTVVSRDQPAPTTITWTIDLQAGQAVRLRIAPPDAEDNEAFRFAVLSDIQDEVDEVGEFWARINADPSLRYVVSAGDITQSGTQVELDNFMETLDELDVPFFTTIGNHEIGPASPEGFPNLYGRQNFQFVFKGVYFTFVDSATATIAERVYDWLEGWLDNGMGATHVFLTHIPPLDPNGIRNGAFRSRNEAFKLLNMLSQAGVDLGLYGHIHSYYAESNATIPIYISGGGGALPERFDGLDRHFLTVDYEPGFGITNVGLVRLKAE